MDQVPKTSDLGPERLARLWDIGSDVHVDPADGAGGSEECFAELLRDWMARPLPPDSAETQTLASLLPEALGRLCRKLRPFSGDSIGFLITSPDTDVHVLTRIKDHAKELGAAATSEIEREVALAVYFAAIASAMVFHDARISQHSNSKLQSAFETLRKRNGVPPELLSLFEKACNPL